MATRVFSPERDAGRIQPPVESPAPRRNRLNLKVLFTGVGVLKATLAAACAYAHDLDARITIVAAQVVPYPLPLEKPTVPAAFLEEALGSLAAEQPIETAVEIYFCRDRWETLRNILDKKSTVIVGGRARRWWPSQERRFATSLKRKGYRVVFVNLEAA